MKQSKRHIGIYLVIAFSIAWVSFASILSFHLHKIYGEDLIGQLHYLKSDQKVSNKENSVLTYKIDFNNGDLIFAENETNFSNYFHIVSLSSQLVKNVLQDCYLTPVLRGPPSIL